MTCRYVGRMKCTLRGCDVRWLRHIAILVAGKPDHASTCGAFTAVKGSACLSAPRADVGPARPGPRLPAQRGDQARAQDAGALHLVRTARRHAHPHRGGRQQAALLGPQVCCLHQQHGFALVQVGVGTVVTEKLAGLLSCYRAVQADGRVAAEPTLSTCGADLPARPLHRTDAVGPVQEPRAAADGAGQPPALGVAGAVQPHARRVGGLVLFRLRRAPALHAAPGGQRRAARSRGSNGAGGGPGGRCGSWARIHGCGAEGPGCAGLCSWAGGCASGREGDQQVRAAGDWAQ